MSESDRRRPSLLRRVLRSKWLRWPLGLLATLIVAVVLAFALSPQPGAALIRWEFERGADQVKEDMEAHAPQGVASLLDQPYRPDDGDARLDVYFPATADQAGVHLPTLIWTHGGAWISGHKDDAAPYFQLIAVEGYAVISLGYSLGPGATYPTPIHQINDALAYVRQNADRFHVDVNRIAMAGDSAGAQLTSQMATLITNPDYAAALGVTPSLQPQQLRGVVLFCGIFDMDAFMEHDDVPGVGGLTNLLLNWGDDTVIWAYTGERGGEASAIDQMSTINWATAGFPPAFISGGNGDPLTDHQSRPLAERLQSLGVPVTSLFYPPDHEPSLPHEYQFDLDNVDGQNALAQMLAFLRAQVGS